MSYLVDASATHSEQWIHARRTVRPRHLHTPGPTNDQLARILSAAAAAPDHGELRPWRFVLVPPAARTSLADAFEQALIHRDTLAAASQREQVREKAYYAPTLLLAVAQLSGATENGIPDHERLVSAGCAIQNMLLVASALGFGSALTSGRVMEAASLRRLFALQQCDRALCFLSFGTPVRHRPPRQTPDLATYFSVLEAPLPDGAGK